MLDQEVVGGLDVHLVGCGGIGSYAALALTKMGFGSFTLYDDDKVEAANVATQAFTDLDVGLRKVQALKGLMERVNPRVEVKGVARRVDKKEGLEIAGRGAEWVVVVAAVDSIPARRDVWKWAKRAGAGLYVDPRMGAETFEMFAIPNPGGPGPFATWFDGWVKDKSGAYSEEPCGAKAIAYTGAMAGAMVASAVRTWVMEREWDGVWTMGDMGTFAFVRRSLEFLKREV